MLLKIYLCYGCSKCIKLGIQCFQCIGLKIDNLGRVSIPTKIVATFGSAFEAVCLYLSNLHCVELVDIQVKAVNMQSSGYFVNIYRFGLIIWEHNGLMNWVFDIKSGHDFCRFRNSI